MLSYEDVNAGFDNDNAMLEYGDAENFSFSKLKKKTDTTKCEYYWFAQT